MKFYLVICLGLFFPANFVHAQKEPVIDVHLHAYDDVPPNVKAEWAAEKAQALSSPNSAREHLEAVLEEMEKNNIEMAVVMKALLDWQDAAPSRFLTGIQTRGGIPILSVDSLDLMVENGSIDILGELGLQYYGLKPTDPRLESYFSLAEEKGIPVCLHTGLGPPGAPFSMAPDFRIGLGRPELFEPVLIEHPKLKAFLAHAGWPYITETIAMMYMYENLYVDIGVLTWALPVEVLHAILKQLIDAGFGKRIMFGSDQMIWTGAISMAVDNLRNVPFLSNEQKRDILYHNAKRFFELD